MSLPSNIWHSMSDLLGIQLAWRLYYHCSILEGILMNSPADYYSSMSRNAFSGSENCTLQRLVLFPGKKSTDLGPVAPMLLLHASRDLSGKVMWFNGFPWLDPLRKWRRKGVMKSNWKPIKRRKKTWRSWAGDIFCQGFMMYFLVYWGYIGTST